MDTFLVGLAVTTAVLGLFWLTQKFFVVLPRSINSPATNARLLWILCSFGLLVLWLNSIDHLLVAQKWTVAFCEKLVWVIAMPYPFFWCVKRVFSRNPEATPLTQASATLNPPPRSIDTDSESQILNALHRGEKSEAIQRYREITGVGLKEAKDFVEDLMLRNPAR